MSNLVGNLRLVFSHRSSIYFNGPSSQINIECQSDTICMSNLHFFIFFSRHEKIKQRFFMVSVDSFNPHLIMFKMKTLIEIFQVYRFDTLLSIEN